MTCGLRHSGSPTSFEHICEKTALQFATCHADHGSKTQGARLSVARGFATYMLGVDPRTEVPPFGLLPVRRIRAKAHIYTNAEVRRVLKAARECGFVYHPLRPGQRKVSTHTLASYRDTFRLLLKFGEAELRLRASDLALTDLAAPFVAKFLDHLESTRSNVVRSRNQRLAAIRSPHAAQAN